MALLAEQTAYETQQKSWLLAEQAFPDLELLARERAAELVGSIVLRQEMSVEYIETEPNESTLLAAVQLAALGDKESEAVVRTNVATDVAERVYKAGHQTSVQLETRGGKIVQNNRELSDIHKNAFIHTHLNREMHYRTKTELKNVFLFEALIASNVMDKYDAVVFSPAPEDKTTRKDYGFFEDTLSCSIQMLRHQKDGLVLETALVAGKKNPTSERHDIDTIHALAVANELAFDIDDASELLQFVILIPKNDNPNGICDVVAQYDIAAGGTFYGESKPVRDYAAYAVECQRRNDSFSEVVDTITQQLIQEAQVFETPLETMERLDYLSERHCVQKAQHDTTINAKVFGATAAQHIEKARYYSSIGDYEAANRSTRSAQVTANSGSCPLFKKAAVAEASSEQSSDEAGSVSSSEGSSGKKWMTCPHCEAKVFDDPCATVLKCWDCKAKVVNGVVRSSGNGGSKKRRQEAAKQKPGELVLAT